MRSKPWKIVAVAAFAAGSCGGASAQSSCAKGSELVLFAAGGRGPGGPPPAQGSASAAALPPQGIYAGCLDRKEGNLSSLGMKAKVDRASWVLVDPKKSVVYATGSNSPKMTDGGSIFSFHIEPSSGTLQPLGVSPSGGSDPTHLAFDPHSGTLFIANHGEGIVGVIKTEANGGVRALSDTAQQEGSGPTPRQKNAEAHGVAVDPSGRFVLCADFGADKIYVYRLDGATGKLSPSSPAFLATPPGTGPRHITFSPDGKYVVLNTELNGQVRVYHWDETAGTLEQTQVVDPFPADYAESKSAAEIEFSKDGHYFYLSLRGKENKLLTYKWDGSDGKLTELDRIPSGGGTPWSFGLDSTGRWMLVANSGTGTVTVFAIDAKTGKLKPTSNSVSMPGVASVAFLGR